MLYYLKKYPISLTIILVVIYLSFFKPPSVEIGKIPGIDKVVRMPDCPVCFGSSFYVITGNMMRSCGMPG